MAVIEQRAEEQRYAAIHAGEERVREHTRVIDLAQILICDMENRIAMWTRGAENLYGFSQAEALDQLAHELLKTEFPESLGRIHEHLRESGSWEGELVRRRKDGNRIVIASRWVLHYANGQPARIVETDTDVTAL